MRLALPLSGPDHFAAHFGAATRFAVFETAPGASDIVRHTEVVPPPGGPCHWLPFLRAAGVDVLLAGAIGPEARARLAGGLEVVGGIAPAAPETLVRGWLAGTLVPGPNRCSGQSGHAGHGCRHRAAEPGDHHGDHCA